MASPCETIPLGEILNRAARLAAWPARTLLRISAVAAVTRRLLSPRELMLPSLHVCTGNAVPEAPAFLRSQPRLVGLYYSR